MRKRRYYSTQEQTEAVEEDKESSVTRTFLKPNTALFICYVMRGTTQKTVSVRSVIESSCLETVTDPRNRDMEMWRQTPLTRFYPVLAE